MNIIIITGASSGIGREFALQIDRYFSNVDEIWLLARRKEKLLALSKELSHETRTYAVDVTKEMQLETLEKNIVKANAKICMLINCAGYGIMGEFAGQERKAALGMVRTNCEALTSVTHRMIPYMKRNGRIIQMASSAAFLPQADFAVYAATKSYVLSFSRALGAELKKRELYVTAVCPGPVDTPFFEIAEQHGKTLAIKKYTMVKPREVVLLALFDSYHKRSISICHPAIRGFALLAKILPHDVLLGGAGMLKKLETNKERDKAPAARRHKREQDGKAKVTV